MMFFVPLMLACLVVLWLGSGALAIVVGLLLPVVVVMTYVVLHADANILVKLIGCVVAFMGCGYWIMMVLDSDNPDRPGDLPVAALFFGIPGVTVSTIAGVLLIIVLSRHREDAP